MDYPERFPGSYGSWSYAVTGIFVSPITNIRLEEWFSGLPSQTSSSQMGILYGKNDDIPAFRWYEKENQKLIVSNHLNDTALIESRHKSS